ncbi:hypothetical protein [Actinomadura sp. 6N118]|uniref:hypothetical protein n=1 Tax=Actinomadura sp. 6N118 TaxID=3375151 RepID=UPI003787D71D
MLIDSIRDLWLEADRLDRPVVSARSAGVPAEAVKVAFGAPVPTDVATWFAWANGVSHFPGQTQDDAALIPGYMPMSVEESAAIRYDSFPEALLGDRWFPLLASGGGDLYVAVFEEASRPSSVVKVIAEEDARPAFNDLEHHG